MTEAIPAVYEDGKFKPLQKVKKELSRITGIGRGNKTDVARKHDRYLY